MRRVSVREVFLVANATLVLLAARCRLRFQAVDKMRRWSTAPGKKTCPQEQLLIAFRRATSRFGGTCLVKAIALQRLLSNYGYPSELRIGVGHNDRGFAAHAWLVEGERILEGAGEEAETYALIANWPNDGPV